MSEAGALRTENPVRTFSLVMSILALIGSGSFAYAAPSPARAQPQLCKEAGELKVSQGQLMTELDEVKAQLAAAQEELTTLRRQLEEAQTSGKNKRR
jgi:hypothetical protein